VTGAGACCACVVLGDGAAVFEFVGVFVLFVVFVEEGPGAGAACCWDGKKAWGIIIKGWFPAGIMGVQGAAAEAFAPFGGIIMGTIIIICKLVLVSKRNS
jgi:hypothetical protein